MKKLKMNSVVKNGGLYIFGNLFNKALAFITVPIFTRILTSEEYGIVNTYASWVALLSVVIGLSLGNSIRNAFVDMKETLGQYISSIFTLAILNFGIVFIISLCINRFLDIENWVLILCLVESFSNFIINSVIMKYVMEEEALKRTGLMVLPNLIGAIVSIVLILNMKDYRYGGRIIGTCVGVTLFAVSIMLYYFIKYRTFISKEIWKYALPISLPLVLHGISVNILGTSDRTIITYFKGAGETGIYSLIYNLSMVASVVTSSAESVWIPRFTRSMIKDDVKEVNREVLMYIYIVLFAFCGLLTISPELVLILGGEEYLSGINMIYPIVMASFVMFMYSIYVNIEYYYKKTAIIAIATVIAAVFNLVLNFATVPLFGATGAAYTTLISYCISFLLHSLNAKKLNKKIVPYSYFVIPIIIMLVVGVIFQCTINLLIIRWAIMILLGVIYVFCVYKFVYTKCKLRM